MGKPTLVLVKCRVNENVVARLEGAGLVVLHRSRDRQASLTQRHADEAAARGEDGYRFQRADAAKNVQADSGVPIYGPEGIQDASLGQVKGDLRTLGLRLASAHVFHKSGDIKGKGGQGRMMFTLVLEFRQAKGDSAPISDEALGAIMRLLARPYGFVHVWENPDGSWTINAAHAKEPTAAAVEGLIELRINPDGSFSPPAQRRLNPHQA